MASSAPFSRLQLAAALLEYDNDNSSLPSRSAYDSAIFAHLRRAGKPHPATRKSDYLGVSLPSEAGGSLSGRDTALDRRSRGSLDALRNPFPAEEDDGEEEEEEEEALEVDLASWGLDAFIPREKGSKNSKGKGRAATLPIQPLLSAQSQPQRRNTRSMSVGNYDHLALQPESQRRKSFGSPLDLVGVEPIGMRLPQKPDPQQEPIPFRQAIPFPTTSTRSPSPNPDQAAHQRTYSIASLDSRMLLKEEDPKRNRTLSNGSMTSRLLTDDNPFALRPPSRASRFDPKAALHARTVSNASMGSRMLLDNDAASVMTGMRPPLQDRPLSTMDLMRPKVLVMPSPLQPISPPAAPSEVQGSGRDGFEMTSDGPPLPPGARTSQRLSSHLDLPSPGAPAIASNSFTPNPRMSLSLSQLTFRNTLLVGGQRDVAYSDIDGHIPRATEDGQQALLSQEPEPVSPDALVPEEADAFARPPGKLYGKSLIDDLEKRKSEMRNKQRVFRGDDRPSMMARGQSQSSTLIDPRSLKSKPEAQHGDPNDLARRNSTLKPLLNFDDDSKVSPLSPGRGNNSRSVFGVDTIWEREMKKLAEIERQERIAAEEEARRVAEEEMKKKKKKKKKQANDEDLPADDTLADPPRVSTSAPVLPAITSRLRDVPNEADEDETESEDEHPRRLVNPKASATWAAGSSSEDEGPRKTTGTGPRYRSRSRPAERREDSSDEDVPLAAAIVRTGSKPRVPASSVTLPALTLGGPSLRPQDDDDDDNEPLGIRASRVLPSNNSFNDRGTNAHDDDDDQPLGLHPEQQRRTQYQMIAQLEQQRQQQMMMQAQMQSSMFFNQQAMASGYFPPVGHPMMMQVPPMQIPSPPPMHDAAKYSSVNRWRHNVAVEGE